MPPSIIEIIRINFNLSKFNKGFWGENVSSLESRVHKLKYRLSYILWFEIRDLIFVIFIIYGQRKVCEKKKERERERVVWRRSINSIECVVTYAGTRNFLLNKKLF